MDRSAGLAKGDLDPRHNNFGLLRVVLASLVVLAHAPELADGDRHREVLTRAFGTLSFGVLAVDGFFLISGFLIVKSWVNKPALGSYLTKRVLRIYPGFVVASIVSVFIVGRLAGERSVGILSLVVLTAKHALTLGIPTYPVPLAFRHFALLDGAMWTIRWEFGCYLLAAAMGLLGLTERRWPWLVLGVAALGVTVYHDRHGILEPSVARFFALFSAGAVLFLYRDGIAYTRVGAIVAGTGLVASLLFSATAQLGLATFGAYLLFALAFADIPHVAHIGTRNDLSYGLYLYAWPIQQLLLLYAPKVPLVGQALLTLGLSCLAGLLSWRLVERGAIRMKLRRTAVAVPKPESTA